MRLNNKADDNAAFIAAQATTDTFLQMQIQQMQPQMTPEQMYHYHQWQKHQMNQPANQNVVRPDPPTASMLATDAQPTATTSPSPIAFPKVAVASVDLDQYLYHVSPNEQNHVGQNSTIDGIFEKHDTNEPDEESAFKTHPSTSADEDGCVVSEEEESLNTTKDDATHHVPYVKDTYEDSTTEGDTKNELSYDGGLTACQAMRIQKKFFHKDAVLHIFLGAQFWDRWMRNTEASEMRTNLFY